jgi:ABC-2 type transport system ATP-binding protein
MEKLKTLLSGLPGVKQVKNAEPHLQIFFTNDTMDLAGINRTCFEQGVVLNHLQLRKKSLESKFMEITK